MATIGLKPCPLCGRSAEFTQPVKGVWNIGCGDGVDTCGLVIFGSSDDKKRDVRDRWNQRGVEDRLREDAGIAIEQKDDLDEECCVLRQRSRLLRKRIRDMEAALAARTGE